MSKRYIIGQEAKILACETECRETLAVFKADVARNANERNKVGHVDHTDKACWSTLLLNVRGLKRQVDKMIEVMGPHLPGA